MATFNEFKQKRYRRQRDGGNVQTWTRQDKFKTTFRPDTQVSGSFIVFDDGSKFRRATAHSKSVFWVEPKSAGNAKDRRNYTGRPGWVEVSEGGYYGDRLMSGNFCFHIGNPVVANINLPPDIHPSMRNECVTKALLDLADAKANIGENLATLRQTMMLVKSPITSIVKDLQKIKASKSLFPLFRKAHREIVSGNLMNRAAEEYLKYVYGWKPLMQDIHGLMLLAKESGKKPLLMHAEGISRREDLLRDRSFGPGSDETVTDVTTGAALSRAKCHLWAQPDPNYSVTRTLNQLGLLNPASLAWELVPASFVVDWMLPIGPVLQALTAPAGLSFVNGSISQRVPHVGPIPNGTWSHLVLRSCPSHLQTALRPMKVIGGKL